jgi:hypothetical protein
METRPKFVEFFIKNKFERHCISLAFVTRINVTTCLDYSRPTPKNKRVYSFL